MWKLKDKHEELLVFNRHLCSRVCSSIKGGLEEDARVHALSFNLLVPFFLPFFASVSFYFLSFPVLHGGGGEKALIIYKC